MIKLLAQITILRRQLISLYCKLFLGKDFTPLDTIADEVACAEAVTTLLTKTGTFNKVIAGTWTLWDALNRDKHWVVTTNPQPGDIIISPTGMSRYIGKAPFPGHVGILGENGLVYSNDSYTGLWATHYTIKTWRDRYEKRGGYPVYFYTYISVL